MKLSINNISFRYDKDYIFDNFSLDVGTGMNFIIGPNNCGKSTLFKIISSKIPYTGNIMINDKDIKRYKDILYLDENYVNSMKGKVYNYLDGVDNKIIDFLEIEEYLEKDLGRLDKDIKIKISIAKYMDSLDVLVVDNMFCWLDKNTRNKIYKKLKSVSKKKIVIIITNNMEDLIYSDRIILLNKGNVVIDDVRDNFYLDKKSVEKYKVDLPFLVDLSYNLKLYDIIDDIYFDIGKLVDAIWK